MKETLKKDLIFIIIDLIMMILLILNLSLIIFDWVYHFDFTQEFFHKHIPEINSYYYQNIHLQFFQIDMIFVSVFLAEFIFGWIVAIVRKTYHSWFFYPIFHWYDLLGCIPLDTFRFVRIFRVFSIMLRLHKLRIIDIRKSYFYKKGLKYYDILVEEISDAVVVKIIGMTQDEISDGGHVVEKIVQDVIKPKEDVLVDWLSEKVEMAVAVHYNERKGDVRNYVNALIHDAFHKNGEIRTIQQIPVVGRTISNTLEHSISDIVYNIIQQAIEDLSSDNKVLIRELTEVLFSSVQNKKGDDYLRETIKSTLIESLEVIKDQVKVKRWMLKELEAEDLDENTNETFDNR